MAAQWFPAILALLGIYGFIVIASVRVAHIGSTQDRCACGHERLHHYNLTGRCALDRECIGFKEKA